MRRKFSKRFKLLIRRLAILTTIGITIPMAIWTGDATATVFLLIIAVPILLCPEID